MHTLLAQDSAGTWWHPFASRLMEGVHVHVHGKAFFPWSTYVAYQCTLAMAVTVMLM
jgi:hypothetical protein